MAGGVSIKTEDFHLPERSAWPYCCCHPPAIPPSLPPPETGQPWSVVELIEEWLKERKNLYLGYISGPCLRGAASP